MAKKYKCKPLLGVIALALLTLGLYFLVWGFMVQRGEAISWSLWNWDALLLYATGIVTLGIGKLVKMKGCNYPFHP